MQFVPVMIFLHYYTSAQETFLIIINFENCCAALCSYFCRNGDVFFFQDCL